MSTKQCDSKVSFLKNTKLLSQGVVFLVELLQVRPELEKGGWVSAFLPDRLDNLHTWQQSCLWMDLKFRDH